MAEQKKTMMIFDGEKWYIRKKVKVMTSYFDGKQRRREEREIYQFVEVDDDEQQPQ